MSVLIDECMAVLERDVHATVDSAKPGVLVQDAVTGARARARRPARRDKPHAISVEIAFVARRDEREGLASDRVRLDFDLCVFLRGKDTSEGRAQIALVQEIAHVLVRRYRGATSLVVPGATFRYADAELVQADEEPESTEIARAVVRVAFTFSEPLAGGAP